MQDILFPLFLTDQKFYEGETQKRDLLVLHTKSL